MYSTFFFNLHILHLTVNLQHPYRPAIYVDNEGAYHEFEKGKHWNDILWALSPTLLASFYNLVLLLNISILEVP